MVLIGEHNNSYIISILQTSMNPLDQLVFPLEILPELNLKTGKFKPLYTNDFIQKSGFDY